MSAPSDTLLAPLVSKLKQWRLLSLEDEAAIVSLPFRVISLRPQEYIVREGDRPQTSCLMLSGFSVRQKVAGNGGRQVFAIHMRGDVADLQNSLLGRADHNLQAITHVEAALIPVQAIQELAFARPEVGRAMWHETLVEGSIFREWTLNVGRRDARSRMAHLLCEFALRFEAAGLSQQQDFELPMSQEQLADSLGLTAVHTNRMLMVLADEGLIARDNRAVRILDWSGLKDVGDFHPAYLHLNGE
jgi:CRP-like cAMP-binding protein